LCLLFGALALAGCNPQTTNISDQERLICKDQIEKINSILSDFSARSNLHPGRLASDEIVKMSVVELANAIKEVAAAGAPPLPWHWGFRLLILVRILVTPFAYLLHLTACTDSALPPGLRSLACFILRFARATPKNFKMGLSGHLQGNDSMPDLNKPGPD
jgi:hypothetical protein